MSKYDVPDEFHERPEDPAAVGWREDTHVHAHTVEIVHAYGDGYQERLKYNIRVSHHDDERGRLAMYARLCRDKGNYWREGDMYGDCVDVVDCPAPVKHRLADALGVESVGEVLPDERLMERDDGTGLRDREDRDGLRPVTGDRG
jgi:hypothetical protein